MASIHALPGSPTSVDVPHEHAWSTESRHRTSAGCVLYVRCTACGLRRVDVQDDRYLPPAPLSRVVGC